MCVFTVKMLSNPQSKTHYQPQLNFSNYKTSLYFPSQSAVLHAIFQPFQFTSIHFIWTDNQFSPILNNQKQHRDRRRREPRILQDKSIVVYHKHQHNKKKKNREHATLVLSKDSATISSNAKPPELQLEPNLIDKVQSRAWFKSKRDVHR